MLLQCGERFDSCKYGRHFAFAHIICGNFVTVDLDGVGVGVLNLPCRGNSSGRLGKKAAPHRHPA